MLPTCWGAGRVYYLIWGVKVVTKASTAYRDQRLIRGPGPWTTCRLALLALLFLCAGCMSLPWGNPKKIDSPAGPADSLVLREGGLERDKGVDSEVQAELEGAKRLFQEKEYAKAEAIFRKVAKVKKVALPV